MRLIYRSRCDHLWEMILWLKSIRNMTVGLGRVYTELASSPPDDQSNGSLHPA